MAKKGTLVVRFIGDTKEFEQSNKKMQTGLGKTGKAIDSSLTQPLGKAGTATTQLGKDFDASGRKINNALSSTKQNIDSGIVQPLKKTETAIKGLGGEFRTEMSKFDSAVGGSRQELAQFQRDLEEIKKTKIAPKIDESEVDSGLDSLKGKLKGGLAGIAAVAGAGLAAGIFEAVGVEAGSDRLAAQLGLSGRKAKQAGKVAGELYAGAYGESLQEVNDAVGAVISSLPGMRQASNKALESATAKALDFAAVFEIDVARAAQVAGQTVRTGLAKNATNAFDLLVAASQKVPAAVREDLIDAIDEYGPFFRTIGLTGEQTFSALATGAQKGMYGIDKTGDAIKEFTIRATDGSEATMGAFADIGLNAEKMSDQLLAGGQTGRKAFDQIIDGLLGIENPTQRANTAITLFGVPLEDLSVSEIPKFLEGLDASANTLGKVEGASKRMGKTLADNAQTNLTSFTRQLKTGFVNVIGGTVIPKLREFAGWLSQNVGPAISDMVQSFKRNWPEIKAAVVPVLNDIGGAIKDFVTLARKVWDKWGDDIMRIAKVVFQGLADTIRGPLKVIRGIIQTITALIEGDWSEAWNGIKQILSGVWETFKGIIVMRLKIIREVIKSGWDAVKDIFKKAWDAIKQGISKAWDAIKKVISTAWNAIKTYYGTQFKILKAAFGKVWDAIKGATGRAWGAIKTVLSTVWNSGIKPVFEAVKEAVKKIPDAFDAAKRGIARIWDGLKKIAAAPINFIINWVYNKGIRKVVNAIPGIDNLPEISPIGFDKGGYTGNRGRNQVAGLVHGREYVINADATQKIEKYNPGFLDRLNKTGMPGHRKGGFINPMRRVYVDGEPLTAIHAAQLAIAGSLMGTRQSVMQGSWQAPSSYSGTSHTGPGVADTSPGSFRAQYVQRRAGIAAWARNIPGAAYAGSGAHVHGISMFSAPGNSQLASYYAGGDGLGGRDYGARPGLLPGLKALLSAFNIGNLISGGLGGFNAAATKESFLDGIAGILDKINNMKDSGWWPLMEQMARSLVSAIKDYGLEKIKDLASEAREQFFPGLGFERPFDNGGILRPGWNRVYNGTGALEPLVPLRPGGTFANHPGRTSSRMSRRFVLEGPIVVNAGGVEIREHFRAVVREEVTDEFAYQAGA